MVDELLENGIIPESDFPYASSVLLVDKKGGDKRLCVDYRLLNKITVPDKYPLSLIEEQWKRLSDAKFFPTNRDLFSGYYQIPVSPESIPLTAFVIQDGHYEFVRVPFGLINAPAVFQRTLNLVLGQLRFTKILLYLDDILIPAATIHESLAILEEVLEIIQKNRITLNKKNVHF